LIIERLVCDERFELPDLLFHFPKTLCVIHAHAAEFGFPGVRGPNGHTMLSGQVFMLSAGIRCL
jgi:hypothetical protein